MNELTEKLKRVGFTDYESRIYIALLGMQPVNGNEIANLSNVPGPKVYGSLQSMVEKGFVSVMYEDGHSKPKAKYMATPYDQLLEAHFKSVSQDIEHIKGAFKKIEESRPKTSLKQELYQILDYDLTFNTIKELIDASEESIYLCCWKAHERLIKAELEVAFKRGVKLVVLLFDGDEDEAPWPQHYHLNAAVVEERHRDEINIVVDEQSVVISQIKVGNVFTVVSENVALIKTTINYIRHDIYVNRVLFDFYDEAMKKYGTDLKDLLNI